MSGNRSLDEFADAAEGDGSGAEASSGDGEAGEMEDGDGHEADAAVVEPASGDDDVANSASVADPETVADSSPSADRASGVEDAGTDGDELDPPASTYAWSPDGGTCAGCGETVEERWRDGDDLVCAGCKEW